MAERVRNRPKTILRLVRHLNNVARGHIASVSQGIPNCYWPDVYLPKPRPLYPELLQVCFSAFNVTPVQLYKVVVFRLLDQVALVSNMIFDSKEILRLDHAGICFFFEFRAKTRLKGVSDLVFTADEGVSRIGIICGLLD